MSTIAWSKKDPDSRSKNDPASVPALDEPESSKAPSLGPKSLSEAPPLSSSATDSPAVSQPLPLTDVRKEALDKGPRDAAEVPALGEPKSLMSPSPKPRSLAEAPPLSSSATDSPAAPAAPAVEEPEPWVPSSHEDIPRLPETSEPPSDDTPTAEPTISVADEPRSTDVSSQGSLSRRPAVPSSSLQDTPQAEPQTLFAGKFESHGSSSHKGLSQPAATPELPLQDAPLAGPTAPTSAKPESHDSRSYRDLAYPPATTEPSLEDPSPVGPQNATGDEPKGPGKTGRKVKLNLTEKLSEANSQSPPSLGSIGGFVVTPATSSSAPVDKRRTRRTPSKNTPKSEGYRISKRCPPTTPERSAASIMDVLRSQSQSIGAEGPPVETQESPDPMSARAEGTLVPSSSPEGLSQSDVQAARSKISARYKRLPAPLRRALLEDSKLTRNTIMLRRQAAKEQLEAQIHGLQSQAANLSLPSGQNVNKDQAIEGTAPTDGQTTKPQVDKDVNTADTGDTSGTVAQGPQEEPQLINGDDALKKAKGKTKIAAAQKAAGEKINKCEATGETAWEMNARMLARYPLRSSTEQGPNAPDRQPAEPSLPEGGSDRGGIGGPEDRRRDGDQGFSSVVLMVEHGHQQKTPGQDSR